MATITRTDKLIWSPSAGAVSYEVTFESAGGQVLNGPVLVSVPEIQGPILVGSAPEGTGYVARVVAIDADGRRSPDATFPNITLNLAPAAVTGFNVVPISP